MPELEVLAVSRRVDCAAGDGFVDVKVAVADFEVESAVRIGADPGLEMNCRALAAEIRERHQVTRLTFLALREITEIHVCHHSQGIRLSITLLT